MGTFSPFASSNRNSFPFLTARIRVAVMVLMTILYCALLFPGEVGSRPSFFHPPPSSLGAGFKRVSTSFFPCFFRRRSGGILPSVDVALKKFSQFLMSRAIPFFPRWQLVFGRRRRGLFYEQTRLPFWIPPLDETCAETHAGGRWACRLSFPEIPAVVGPLSRS